MKKKTLKQKWQFERTFHHVGTLVRVKDVLHRIADADSTLPHETKNIRSALWYLDRLDFKTDLDKSCKKFIDESV